MAINSYDIVSTLQALGMMKYWKGKHIILKKQVRTCRLSCDRGPQPLQVATRATGISDFRDTWMQINPTQGKQNLFLPFFVFSFIFITLPPFFNCSVVRSGMLLFPSYLFKFLPFLFYLFFRVCYLLYFLSGFNVSFCISCILSLSKCVFTWEVLVTHVFRMVVACSQVPLVSAIFYSF
jgi:hypothetical protein